MYRLLITYRLGAGKTNNKPGTHHLGLGTHHLVLCPEGSTKEHIAHHTHVTAQLSAPPGDAPTQW